MAVFRIEVRPSPGNRDPRGDATFRQAEAAGITTLPTSVDTTAVYLVEGEFDNATAEK